MSTIESPMPSITASARTCFLPSDALSSWPFEQQVPGSPSDARAADGFQWLTDDEGAPCVVFAVTVPTFFNPPLGLVTGAPIPTETILRIKEELCSLVVGWREEAAECLSPHVVAHVVNGAWREPDAAASGGFTHYCDPNALRLVANVNLGDAALVKQRLLAYATQWAAMLRQQTLYVEVMGCGHVRHYYVRPAHDGGERQHRLPLPP